MWGWPSPRHMRRGLPPRELRRLEDFYEDYGRLMGWLKDREPGEDEPAHPADSLGDWEAERIQGKLVSGELPER